MERYPKNKENHQKFLVTPHFGSTDLEQDYWSYTGDDTTHHQLQEEILGSAEKPGGTSKPFISATAGLSSTIEEDPPPATVTNLPQKLLITPHFSSIDVEQYYWSYTGDDTSHHQLQEDILGSEETPGGTSGPLISATAGLSSTTEEDPLPTTASALPQKLLMTLHFGSIDLEHYYCSYTGDDTSHHQLQEDIPGSAETPGGTSEPLISTTASLSSTIEEDPPPTIAAALPQELIITPHFGRVDVEQYYCSYTGVDTSHHHLQEYILALLSLESSLCDEDDSISSKTNEVDQDTRLVEVLCQVVKDFKAEPELWVKQYNSRQKILLVGEGDFSLSTSLAAAFGSAANIVATSLDSEGFLTTNYGRAMDNIGCLRAKGAKVFHGVDATEMAEYSIFQGKKFDRVVFNFPHAGFFRYESRESQLQRNRNLIRLFMRNAKKMIVETKGEIHITHKSNGFFAEWDLQQLASSEGLQLKQEVHFNFRDYPGYRTKYGFGGDNNFNCNPSKSYIFGLIKINA